MSITKTRLAAAASLLTLAGLTTAGLSPAVAAEGCAGKANHVYGTTGNDVLVGTRGRDVIKGFGGNDIIRGKGGNDSLYGGRGSDTVSGGGGRDCIFGGPDDDVVYDQNGNGGGNNSIDGGGGEDTGLYDETSQWTSVERGTYWV